MKIQKNTLNTCSYEYHQKVRINIITGSEVSGLSVAIHWGKELPVECIVRYFCVSVGGLVSILTQRVVREYIDK